MWKKRAIGAESTKKVERTMYQESVPVSGVRVNRGGGGTTASAATVLKQDEEQQEAQK
jgi:hypothetical protein